MLDDGEAAFPGNLGLSTLNFRIVEFLDTTALQTNQVVVVLTVLELKHSLARLEMVPLQQASLLELGEHAIDGSQTYIGMFSQQLTINILGGKMACRRLAEQVKDGHARGSGLEADVLEFGGIGHGCQGLIGESGGV